MTIADNREDGGRLVREAWICWADAQPNPKPSWLVPWEGLSEADKEADRVIWDHITSPYRDVIASLAHENDALRQAARTYLTNSVPVNAGKLHDVLIQTGKGEQG